MTKTRAAMRDRSGVGVSNSTTKTGIKRIRVSVTKFGRLSDSCPTDLHAASTRFIVDLFLYLIAESSVGTLSQDAQNVRPARPQVSRNRGRTLEGYVEDFDEPRT